MTPYELRLHIEEYGERMQREQESAIVAAYLGAYWQRVKRLEPLKKVLQRMKPQQTQSDMLAEVKKLNAAFGGKVVYRERREP